VAEPQVQTAQVQEEQLQAEVFSVFMANLESESETRRSGVSGLRTRQLQGRRSS
jgi:hypothetical protein